MDTKHIEQAASRVAGAIAHYVGEVLRYKDNPTPEQYLGVERARALVRDDLVEFGRAVAGLDAAANLPGTGMARDAGHARK